MAFKLRLILILILFSLVFVLHFFPLFIGRGTNEDGIQQKNLLPKWQTLNSIRVIADTSQMPANSSVVIVYMQILTKFPSPPGTSSGSIGVSGSGPLTIHGGVKTTVCKANGGPLYDIIAQVKFPDSPPQQVNSDFLKVPDGDVLASLILKSDHTATFVLL